MINTNTDFRGVIPTHASRLRASCCEYHVVHYVLRPLRAAQGGVFRSNSVKLLRHQPGGSEGLAHYHHHVLPTPFGRLPVY